MTFSWWLSRRRGHACGCEENEVCRVDDHSRTLEFVVEGMNCSHCADSIQRAVSEMAGVTDCRVYLEDGRAIVQGRDLDTAKVVGVIEGLGYKVRLQTE
jgi:copper chaperone CopZ